MSPPLHAVNEETSATATATATATAAAETAVVVDGTSAESVVSVASTNNNGTSNNRSPPPPPPPPSDFASIRVLAKQRSELHDFQFVEQDNTASFYDDLVNFTPGGLPRVTTIAITIGIVCGIVAYLYYAMLFFLLEYIWNDLPTIIIEHWSIPQQYHWLWIVIIGYICAIFVGLSVKYLGEPGDLSYTVQCVRDTAYIKMDHVLPMIVASQFSILGGGSLGPEAPLVAICAAFAGLIGRKVFGTNRKDLVRKHTLMGMACALAAFFGIPLGGSLFALEINNRFGIEYYEHTMDAIFSGTVCLVVFRGLAQLEIGPVWQLSDEMLPPSKPITVMIGALLGLGGAGIAALFVEFHKLTIGIFRKYGLMDNKYAVRRALLGSTGIIIIGVCVQHTLFWGEEEIQIIATASSSSELPNVFPTSGLFNFEITNFGTAFTVGILKMVSISFTVAAGYRGGFIFPFFAAGSAFGKALVYLIPTLSPTLAVLCFAAGINVAITRTALASTLILCGLAGEINAGPPVLAASMISLFATKYMPFIRSQSSRDDVVRKNLKPIEGAKWLHENFSSRSLKVNNKHNKTNSEVSAASFASAEMMMTTTEVVVDASFEHSCDLESVDQLTPLVQYGKKSYNT